MNTELTRKPRAKKETKKKITLKPWAWIGLVNALFVCLWMVYVGYITFHHEREKATLLSMADDYRDQRDVDEGILKLVFDDKYDRESIQLSEVTVSAYSSTRSQTDDTPYENASGGNTFVGQLAVSRDLINRGLQFGDTVYLVGIGLFKVQDVMAPRWKNKVDIWCSDVKACRLFGTKDKIAMIWMEAP